MDPGWSTVEREFPLRAALRLLEEGGYCPQQGRRILAAGLAGEGRRDGRRLLFRSSRVADLLARRNAIPAAVSAAERSILELGRMVVRLGPRGQEATMTLEELSPRLEGPWHMSLMCRALLGAQIRELGAAPLVATVCGFVVATADITDLSHSLGGPVGIGLRPAKSRELATFTLREPGAWADDFHGARFATGPGNSWVWWTPEQARCEGRLGWTP